MASFIPQITDTNLQSNLYTPDFSFLAANMQKKEQQYAAGLSEVASGYNAILNAPVTNDMNKQVKAQYAQDAQNGLKKLSSSDLSLPSNVAQAETLYAPFWQDSKLLQDIAWTKKGQQQLQKGQSLQFSKDEDIRDTYDARMGELINYQLNRLKNTDRNSPDYDQIQIDDWMPFTKIGNVLRDHKVADKMEVSFDIPTADGRMMTIVNGPGSIPNYRTYADGILGTQYNEQYKILGKLSMERAVSQYQQANPGSTRQQALSYIAIEAPDAYHTTVADGYAESISTLGHTIETKQADLADLNRRIAEQGGTADPEQDYNRKKLQTEIHAYTSRRGELEKNYRSFTSEEGRKEFAMHPESGIAMIYRNQDIDKWANSMAADEDRKLAPDEAFWKNATLRHQNDVLHETSRHNQVEEGIGKQNANTGVFNAETNRLSVYGQYPDLQGATANNPNPGFTFAGYNTAAEYTPEPTEAANEQKRQLFGQIVGTVYNPGGLGVVLDGIPANIVSAKDNLNFMELMSKGMTGQITEQKDDKGVNRFIGASQGDILSYNKMVNFLTKETGISIQNLHDANAAMLAYVAKTVNNKNTMGAMDPKQAEFLRKTYTGIKDKIDIYEKDEAERAMYTKRSVNDKNSPNYKAPYVTYKDLSGTYKQVTPEVINQVAPFPHITVRDVETGKVREFTPLELAELHTQGRWHGYEEVQGGGGNKTKINFAGRDYNIVGVNGKTYTKTPYYDSPEREALLDFRNMINGSGPDNRYQQSPNSTLAKFGTPEAFKTNKDKLEHAVIPQTSLYNSAANELNPRWQFDTKDKTGKAQNRLIELASPGNYTAMYAWEAGKGGKPAPLTSAEDQDAVRKLINDPKYQEYIGKQGTALPKGFTGKPQVEIIIGDFSKSEDKSIPENIKKLSGKHILIEESPNAQGTYINQFPRVHDYSWHPLQNGQAIVSDAIEEATGQGSFQILPFPRTNPTQYKIVLNKNLVNKETGKTIVVPSTVTISADQYDPEFVTRQTRDLLNSNGNNYYKNLDQYRKTLNTKQH